MSIQIANVDCLTDEFIASIDSEQLSQAYGVKAFGGVDLFLKKIKDKSVRYLMMKKVVQIM